MASTPRYDTSTYVERLRNYGFDYFVQGLIHNCWNSLRIIDMHKEMKGYDFSKRLAMEKLRVYLTLLKGDAQESRAAIDSFKTLATDMLSEAMDDKLGNVAVLHSQGGYSEDSKKTDEQSRQLARTLQNSVEVMDFLHSRLA